MMRQVFDALETDPPSFPLGAVVLYLMQSSSISLAVHLLLMMSYRSNMGGFVAMAIQFSIICDEGSDNILQKTYHHINK